MMMMRRRIMIIINYHSLQMRKPEKDYMPCLRRLGFTIRQDMVNWNFQKSVKWRKLA